MNINGGDEFKSKIIALQKNQEKISDEKIVAATFGNLEASSAINGVEYGKRNVGDGPKNVLAGQDVKNKHASDKLSAKMGLCAMPSSIGMSSSNKFIKKGEFHQQEANSCSSGAKAEEVFVSKSENENSGRNSPKELELVYIKSRILRPGLYDYINFFVILNLSYVRGTTTS